MSSRQGTVTIGYTSRKIKQIERRLNNTINCKHINERCIVSTLKRVLDDVLLLKNGNEIETKLTKRGQHDTD